MADGRAPRKVTEREREYMRRLGRIHEEIAADELRAHLAKSPYQRLAAAFGPMARGPYFEPIFPLEADDPAAFYERAKRLGLYRG